MRSLPTIRTSCCPGVRSSSRTSESSKELSFEGLRVWFPNGPSNAELAILAVRVEEATYWTNAASTATYAWAYVRAALTHKSSSPGEIGDAKSVRF
jgi:pyridoxamine 5'-phosphate oxidase like protein